ncbi:hypothetical protein DPMN_110027 [Dreissena polymorpha]|uniref:Uncharacterized protein n=1 Tax=Dreissena polymorpha TaxID=45954 RepID=A0A9D4QMJ7_DREPO|nr:hypothetical protein DPMN_110027 [Dreissena polymorpha]
MSRVLQVLLVLAVLEMAVTMGILPTIDKRVERRGFMDAAHALREMCDLNNDGVLNTPEEKHCYRKHTSFFTIG